MLLVTMALLGGASVISVLSVRGAASLVSGSANDEARSIGELVEVVSTRTNSSGSYIWLYNYGWVDSEVSSVLLNGLGVAWTHSGALTHGSIYAITLPAEMKGIVTVVLRDKSLAVAL